jgi:phosphoenolpyruvate synthase/pyruvate phosphate dikinase
MNGSILPLVEADDVKLAGGKGAALSRLIKAGFNVPPGFVVTTVAGKEATKEILDEFDKLGVELVAVRSSATTEDGARDAWAGQFDTFLNVKRQGLIEAIEKCRLSASSDRARSYAESRGLQTGAVAVVVQKMVRPTTAGVAFSIHPVTQAKDQLVIEVVIGLADQLVSGTITPDTYIIDKKSGVIIEKHLISQQILDDKDLKVLADTIKKVEADFHFPVDVEWAFAGDELFILQSRPITTLG